MGSLPINFMSPRPTHLNNRQSTDRFIEQGGSLLPYVLGRALSMPSVCAASNENRVTIKQEDGDVQVCSNYSNLQPFQNEQITTQISDRSV